MAVAATLAAPVIAYLAIKSAAIGLGGAAGVAAGALPPRDHGPAVKLTARAVQIPQQQVTPDMAALARDGLTGHPLAHEPFFIAARAEEQAGRLDRAILLMEEARRRRPTSSAARMQLLTYYTKAARYRDALAEMDLLLRRNGEIRRALLPEVAKLAAHPAGRDALAAILAGEPEWREEFFRVAARQNIRPEDARTLYTLVRSRKKGDVGLERQLVLQSLAGAGRFRQARAEWLQALPPQDRGRQGLVFDPAFTGARAPLPFGWLMTDVESGRAEVVREGGRSWLDVAYFGGSDIVLAEQTLALPPGRFQLRTIARTDGTIEAGRLQWRLSCLPKGPDLTSVELAGAGSAAKPFAGSFTVPVACEGQRLALVARAGDTAGQTAARIDRVEVVR